MLHVSDDVKLALAAIFQAGWRIATAFKIPGTNINIPEFCIACLVLILVLRRGPRLLGFGPWADHDIAHPEFMGDSLPGNSRNANSGGNMNMRGDNEGAWRHHNNQSNSF